MHKKQFLFLILIFIPYVISNYGIQHTNYFEPYEFLLDINRLKTDHPKCSWQTGIRGEFGFNFRGFPVDTKDALLQNYNCKTITANPAQYLYLFETVYAPFLGINTTSNDGQFAQQFNPYNASTAAQLVLFNGSMSLANITGLIEFWYNKNIKIAYYLPFYQLSLSTLSHQTNNKKKFFEQSICPDIYAVYQQNAPPTVPYELTGIGDSELIFSWQNYFYENRDFIRGLFACLRGGLYLSTGQYKEQYLNTFLKIPLGYDAAWGIPFGGSIEIDINCYGGLGISADCITFFPYLMPRIIKTDMRQTDMLTLSQSQSLLNPGFKESFSVYLIGHDIEKNFLATAAYQYNKQNESDIVLCQTEFSNLIAQTAEILESWTNHNLIFILQGTYDINKDNILGYELFFKYGFSGSRSIVANTLGLQIEYIY